MIKIQFYNNGLLIKGHSNAAEKGKDIYCAAVSAISQSSINWFKPEEIFWEIKEGYLLLKLIKLSDSNLYLLSLVKIQLESILDEHNKKFISFKEIKEDL